MPRLGIHLVTLDTYPSEMASGGCILERGPFSDIGIFSLTYFSALDWRKAFQIP